MSLVVLFVLLAPYRGIEPQFNQICSEPVVCDECILTVERANIFMFFCRTGSEACEVFKDLESSRGFGCPRNSKVSRDLACGFNPAERGPRKCSRFQRCPRPSKV